MLLNCIPILYPKHFIFGTKDLYSGSSMYLNNPFDFQAVIYSVLFLLLNPM